MTAYDPSDDYAEQQAEARADAWMWTTRADQDFYGGRQEARYEKHMGW